MKFTSIELDVAKEVVNIGLSRAADSFSSILKQKALFLDHRVCIEKIIELNHMINKQDTDLYSLITEIRGQMNGVCFLLFTQEEADLLKRACLPESMHSPEHMKEMGDALLLEIDNMISAAVVTEFANVMDLMIYGDVPQLHQLSRDATLEKINSYSTEYEYYISFKAKLETENNVLLEPEFVWLLGKDFANEVKKLTTKSNILDLLKDNLK